jgi:predicted component of type VI protein secretion system
MLYPEWDAHLRREDGRMEVEVEVEEVDDFSPLTVDE